MIARAQLAEINQINLENIRNQTDVLGRQIKEGLQPAFEILFQDMILGGKTLGEMFNNLIGSVAQLLAQLAARALVKTLFGSIFNEGGTVNTFAYGRQVKNYAAGGDVTALGLSIAAAMKREGPLAVPIVASIGEEVLSTRNGDAQFYRALKQRGAWGDMKINNFAQGGTVNPATSVTSMSSTRNSSNLMINVPVTVEKGADLSTEKANRLSQSISVAVKHAQ